jgi:hypothetical protein
VRGLSPKEDKKSSKSAVTDRFCACFIRSLGFFFDAALVRPASPRHLEAGQRRRQRSKQVILSSIYYLITIPPVGDVVTVLPYVGTWQETGGGEGADRSRKVGRRPRGV